MVMLVVVLPLLLFLRKWVAVFITCCAEAVDCAAEIFTVTATIAFLACLVLCSTAAANVVHWQWWAWWTNVNVGVCYLIVYFPNIL